ncbi:MAG TPA: bifunctional diaminohydroxyphosphoribosylaminopyrimidine deaminase/5-amino-6-(5-phosphoribosylamino)uracil reductase RibD [Gammaproteobacteria bacterium]|nr:bifunctional diaminohydroxyphosphoribosylaminopyrimidine deaminase/5-amino-6-(5-phosphoribosylamino)uracil reductase RibD [Gammaproteobacteria bacterium]
MSPAAVDRSWMAAALLQARKGLYSTHPNPRVGCVIVKDGERIASGWHEYAGGAHAEVNAIAAAPIPAGADFYVTLEPCSHHGRTPPCVDALIEARAARVIVAVEDPNPEVGGRGLERLRDSGIEVVTGVLEQQARELNRGFFRRMLEGLPFLSIKMACSLDGRSALANGVSKWITGEPARRDVQFQRAQASAILTSAQTVIDDNPSLDLRLTREDLGQRREPRQPVRVVVDSQLRLTGQERIFGRGGEIWIYTLADDAMRRPGFERQGVQVIEVAQRESGRISLQAVMRDLAERGINEVHSECGPRLAGALIDAGLADQILLYMAPRLLGNGARGVFDLGEIAAMDESKSCRICDIRQIGDDLRLTLNPA